MQLPTSATLPTAKPAAPAAAPAAETPTPAATPAVETPAPTPASETPATKAPAKRRSAVDSIGDKVTAALAAEAAKKNGTAEPATTGDDPTVDAPKVEPTAPTAGDDSDDALKAEIETKTKQMDAAGRKAFADLRYELRELKRTQKDMVSASEIANYKTQLADLTTKLEQASATKQADPAEVQSLKDRIAEMEQRDSAREEELTAVKVERTDAFQKAVTQPRAEIVAKLEKLAKKYERPVGEFLAALNDTSDSQSDLLIEAASGMNKIEEMEFFGMVTKMRDIAAKEETFRGQAKEALAKITAASTQQTEAQRTQQRQALDAAHTAVWSKLSDALPDVLKPLVGDDAETLAWNTAQTDALSFARSVDLAALTPDVASELIQRGSVHHLVVGAMQAYKAQLAEAETARDNALTELAKFQKSKPGAQGTPRDTTTAPATRGGKADFVKSVDEKLRAAGF